MAITVVNSPDPQIEAEGIPQEPMIAETATIDALGIDLHGGDLGEGVVSIAFAEEDTAAVALSVLEGEETEENEVYAAGFAQVYNEDFLLAMAWQALKAVEMIREAEARIAA